MGLQAISIYNSSNQIENELSSKMILADYYVVIDYRNEARLLAEEVLPQANAMDYKELEESALMILNDDTIWDKLVNEIKDTRLGNNEIGWSKMSDQELKRAAVDWLIAMKLPQIRLSIIEKDVFSFRDIGQEKIEWCRYIELTQELSHQQSTLTMYAKDPKRHCRCSKYLYESNIGHEDWKIVIKSFKSSRCAVCPSRSPLKDEEPQQ